MTIKTPKTLRYAALLLPAVLSGAVGVSAVGMSSTNYKIDDSAINSFGGAAGSANYSLVDSGGEAFIGAGSSANYKFNAGYVASLEHSITLSLDALAVTIPKVTPGTSQTATSTVSVYTDAAGYLLSARYDRQLRHTDGTTTVANVGSTIAAPGLWTEGTTKGFGFGLTAGTSLDSKWGSNPNYKYAAFTDTATIIHDKPLYVNSFDPTTVQYRLDVPATQLPGAYSNNVTYLATVKP